MNKSQKNKLRLIAYRATGDPRLGDTQRMSAYAAACVQDAVKLLAGLDDDHAVLAHWHIEDWATINKIEAMLDAEGVVLP